MSTGILPNGDGFCEPTLLRVSSSSGVSGKQTSMAVVQAGEDVSLPAFQRCRGQGKPMVEMEAGSNAYYQATVAFETHNEIKFFFPPTTANELLREEWVKKSSSRIWRGSLSRKVWKHKGRGAWEPRPMAGKARRKASLSTKKRRASVGPIDPKPGAPGVLSRPAAFCPVVFSRTSL